MHRTTRKPLALVSWVSDQKKMPRLGGVPGQFAELVVGLDRRLQPTHTGLQGPYIEIDCYGRLGR